MLVCERRAGGTDCVELVVFAAQPPLAAGRAAEFEHRLTAPGEIPGKAGAVAAAALDRPRAPTRRVTVSNAKQLAVAARVRRCRRPSDKGACWRNHDR